VLVGYSKTSEEFSYGINLIRGVMLKSRNVLLQESASSPCRSLRIRIKFEMSQKRLLVRRKACVAVPDVPWEALRQATPGRPSSKIARISFENKGNWQNRGLLTSGKSLCAEKGWVFGDKRR